MKNVKKNIKHDKKKIWYLLLRGDNSIGSYNTRRLESLVTIPLDAWMCVCVCVCVYVDREVVSCFGLHPQALRQDLS
jgi:hypothetical protein